MPEALMAAPDANPIAFEFRPTGRRTAFKVIVGLTALTGVVAFALAVTLSPIEGTDVIGRLVAVAVLAALGSLVAYEAFTIHAPSVDSNGISLERPIRRGDGRRTRVIAFHEIAEMDPTVVEGYNGLVIMLQDGVKTFLPQSAFGDRGLRVMSYLASRHNKQYEEGLKRLLLAGTDGQEFRVAAVRAVAGGSIILKRSIPSYAGPSIRKFSHSDIVEMEPVSTPYTGNALLVTFRDRTRFLLHQADADRAGFQGSRSRSGEN